MSISFEKATHHHRNIIFSWLAEPFVQEFWDNSQEHKNDILNFMEGRKKPSSYCDGKYIYWIAKIGNEPFALIMTIQETREDDIEDIKIKSLSNMGHTYGIDYMIGNKNYFGKGYGSQTLDTFIEYFRKNVDLKADTFFIDPACDNPRAAHVYQKAGFELVGDFVMEGPCSGQGKMHHLFVKRFSTHIKKEIKNLRSE